MILGNSYRIDLKTTWSIQIKNPSALGLLFPWMAQLRTRPARRLQKAFRKAWWTSRRTQWLQRWLDHRTWGCIGWSLFSWYMIYIMLRIRGLMQKSLGSPVQIHPYLENYLQALEKKQQYVLKLIQKLEVKKSDDACSKSLASSESRLYIEQSITIRIETHDLFPYLM